MDYNVGCTILCKIHLELNIYPFGNLFLGLKDWNVGFNFSSPFYQVSQIDLNTIQQYVIHPKTIAIMTSKKSTIMWFYPLKLTRFLYLKVCFLWRLYDIYLSWNSKRKCHYFCSPTVKGNIYCNQDSTNRSPHKSLSISKLKQLHATSKPYWHNYKMWVQFTNPCSLNRWIHCSRSL